MNNTVEGSYNCFINYALNLLHINRFLNYAYWKKHIDIHYSLNCVQWKEYIDMFFQLLYAS